MRNHFESVFEAIIVRIQIAVSVGGRKHKRLILSCYPVTIVVL